MTARRAAGFVLAALALSGAGCSSGTSNAGSPLPPLTTPPVSGAPTTAVASPTPPPPPPPPPADPVVEAKTSAEAFVRDYYAEVNKAARTNDTARLETMSYLSCRVCRDDLARMKSRQARGLVLDNDLYSLAAIDVGTPQGNLVSVSVFYTVQRAQLVDSQGAVRAISPEQPRKQAAISLARGARDWVVQDILSFGSTT